ncbi:MAG TPA: NAD(P)H-binding protein [Polyangiaceae bacterium]|nr:NAD(P)H-binding protein [Polyangiaceae bacterium]
MKVLVAGASGVVGREIVLLLKQRGHFVRTLSKSVARAEPLRQLADEVRVLDATLAASVEGSCHGLEMVISALGAPVSANGKERRSFAEVDLKANLNLLAEARRAGVRRFVYVGVFSQPAYASTAYVQAHAQVERAIREAGIEYGFVRTTGVYGALAEMLSMALKGPLPVIDDGSALTNPIDERDVAEAVLCALDAPGSSEVDIGGPETLSRRQIAETAFSALGRPARLFTLPLWALKVVSFVYGLFNRRMGEFLAFMQLALTHSCVAPTPGKRRLLDHFAARARALGRTER